MRDYKKLINVLRTMSEKTRGLSMLTGISGDGLPVLFDDSADAIEELLAAVRSVVHCKDCEWWTKQEASIQGRCARLAIYPTGEFYCASGSKREPPKEVE